MSETTFVFDADSAGLVKASKSVAAAASQIEKAQVSAGKAANVAATQQVKSQAKVTAGQRQIIDAAKAAGRVTDKQARDAYRAAQRQARGLGDIAEATHTIKQIEEDLAVARARGDRDATRRLSLNRKFTKQQLRDLETQRDLTRQARLGTAQRATRFIPGRLGGAAARGLAASGLSGGAIAGIGTAATALGGVALAAGAVVAAYKGLTTVLAKNTELQAAQDRAASGSVLGTATAQQEFVKNTGALGFAAKQAIVEVAIPRLQRDVQISGFNDLVRAVGAATSAGGSPELALSATRQAAMLYPFDPAATQGAAPQLALIAKALGEQNAQLAGGIVLKTNEFSPIKDIGQLSQSLPAIFSAARRLDASAAEFGEDAKFASALFASVASESADNTGERTKTLLRTLIPMINRFFAGRGDVGSSLGERFNRLTTSEADRSAFLGQSGIPGGAQRDIVEKLFAQGSPLNTGVQSTAGAFQDLNNSVAQYSKQIKELTATTQLAVQQQKLLLGKEERQRDPGAQARGTIREVFDEAKALSYSDDPKSIAKLAGDRLFHEGLLNTDAFRYGSSEQVNAETQRSIDRTIEALEAGGVTPQERLNIAELKKLKGIANETVKIDRGSRVPRTEEYLQNNIAELDKRERARESKPDARYLRELEQRDRVEKQFSGTPGNNAANYLAGIAEDNRRKLEQLPSDPIDRAVRQQEIAYLKAYRAGNDAIPGAAGRFNSAGVTDGARAGAGAAGAATAEAMSKAAEKLNSVIGLLGDSAAAQRESAENMRNATRPRAPDHRVPQRARANAAARG